MTLKKRLVITIILMLVIPLLVIALLSALMFAEVALTDGRLFSNVVFEIGSETISGERGGDLIGTFALWVGISLALMIGSVSIGVIYISRKLLAPMRELTRAAQRIRDGQLEFDIMSATDAEAKELCDAFDDMRRRLKEGIAARLDDERRRNEMLASISHDLRTPVTSIKGYVEGIFDGVASTPEMQTRYLETIYVKAAAMERLVEQMSDYSELELGRMQFNLERVNAAGFFNNVCEEHYTDFEASDATLAFSCEITDEETLIDADKTRRVFENLLSNSLKYRDENRPLCVSFSVTRAGGSIHAVVADNGRGIAESDLHRVFEGFYRSDPSRGGRAGGHGLGLAIARNIVQKQNGKIWLQSAEDVGTEVHVTLPIV